MSRLQNLDSKGRPVNYVGEKLYKLYHGNFFTFQKNRIYKRIDMDKTWRSSSELIRHLIIL